MNYTTKTIKNTITLFSADFVLHVSPLISFFLRQKERFLVKAHAVLLWRQRDYGEVHL